MGKVKRELFEPTQDVFEAITNNSWDLYEQLEKAEFELISALEHWKELRNKINKDFNIK